jgi:hypothetical protein
VAESADRYCVHRLPTGLDDYDGARWLLHLVIVAGELPAGLDGRRSRVHTRDATAIRALVTSVPPGPVD